MFLGTILPMHAMRNPTGKRKNAWQILLCLTLLALLFRAAFPTGYMPGLSGPGGGALTVALCTGYEQAPVRGHDDAPHHDGTHQVCLFSAVAAQAIVPGAGTPAIAALAQAVIPPHPDGIAPLPVPIFGPPLGPRAPPVRLG
ncbi:hypothetical protein ACMHYJ_02540 [Castellaniella hirudinis]|uniref:hypothetical protein n=1 Tax=Castellaniella hirudinis TaxID=1144617 RepID=UPI0039C19528